MKMIASLEIKKSVNCSCYSIICVLVSYLSYLNHVYSYNHKYFAKHKIFNFALNLFIIASQFKLTKFYIIFSTYYLLT